MTGYASVLRFWNEAQPSYWHRPDTQRDQLLELYQKLYATAVGILGRAPQSIIDWGVGGGIMARIACTEGVTYYAVDIIQSTLDACWREVPAIVPVLIDIENPEDSGVPPADMFICLTVYQHMPDMAYAERVTRLAADHLHSSGVALFQTRMPDSHPTAGATYASNWNTRTLMTEQEFNGMATSAGLTLAYRHPDGPRDYYYSIWRKP